MEPPPHQPSRKNRRFTRLLDKHIRRTTGHVRSVDTKTLAPAEDAPSDLWTAPPGPVLIPKGVSSRFSLSGPSPAHPCVRQGRHPRTCQVFCCPALRVRPRRSARPDSPGDPSPSPSQECPSQQPRNLENPHLSGGTSGRYWAASTGSLRAYRGPSGQSLWDSWTPRPTCGVCVTTTLPRCPNGARDR